MDTEKYGYTPSAFHIALPFSAICYHYQLGYIENRHEHPILQYIKRAIYAAFLLIVVWTFVSQTLTLKIMTAFALLIVPALLIVYTYAIFNVKCMSGNRVGVVRAVNTGERQGREGD